MPATERAQRLTGAYRQRLVGLRNLTMRSARARWGDVAIDDLDGSFERWALLVAAAIETAQERGVRATDAYLAAYLAAELRERTATAPVEAPVGQSRDGRPLAEVLVPALYTIKRALGQTKDPADALKEGLARALYGVSLDVLAAPREAMSLAISEDDRIDGWRRVCAGSACGACLGAATGAVQESDRTLAVHGGCQCVKEPVVRGIRERVSPVTGTAIFARLTPEEQDRRFGPEKADLLRSGEVELPDLVARSAMATEHDHITEAPLTALTQP